jgi:hypothetical protein
LEILCDDGRRVWTEEAAVNLALDKIDEFQPLRAGAVAMLEDARSKCVRAGLLRKLSYVEFLWDAQYRGFSLCP